jgi:hypothetical protein
MPEKLLGVVNELRLAFQGADVVKLRVLSNSLIEEAALENDRVAAEVALVGYSLHKLSTKAHIVGHSKWQMVKNRVVASLERAARALEKNREAEFERTVKGIVRDINAIDAELGNFVRSLHEKARVKYAASAYSLGLSLSQAAELTGADKKDVLEYVGETRMSDREEAPPGIRARLKRLREMM